MASFGVAGHMSERHPGLASSAEDKYIVNKQQVVNLLQQQRFSEAQSACQTLCAKLPQDAEAWFLLGAIQGQLGNYSDAENSCRTALKLQPNQPALHYNLAITLLRQQQADAAIPHLRQAIGLNPGYIEAHLELGNALQLTGEHAESLACYEQAMRLNPNIAAIHFNAGNANRELHQWNEAIACYQRALQLQPDLVPAYVELSKILIRLYRLQETVELLSKALSVLPNAAEIHFNLGLAYQEQGEAERAQACYQRTLDLDSKHEGAQAGMAGVLGLQGKYDEAHTLLRPLISRPQPNTTAVITFGHFAHRLNKEDEAMRILDETLHRGDLPTDAQAKLHFAIAKIYDRRNLYSMAFEHFQKGNEYTNIKYSPKTFAQVIAAFEETFSSNAIGRLPRSTKRSKLPVFIVGMPRSGTSLVEQILASHPGIFGAGELHAINNLVLSLPVTFASDKPYPLCINAADQISLDRVANLYLDELNKRSGGAASRVTDKMPQNFLHLGLIDLLFPGARVIHCMRDPMDTCLSCYFHNFSGEHAYAYNLQSLGTYYRQYEQLMAHWRSTIRIPMLEVRYEDIVTNPEQTTRALVDFCDLPWNDRCLRFYETQRTVATASHDQVRRPVYASSVGRWKHYEPFLAPLKSALGLP